MHPVLVAVHGGDDVGDPAVPPGGVGVGALAVVEAVVVRVDYRDALGGRTGNVPAVVLRSRSPCPERGSGHEYGLDGQSLSDLGVDHGVERRPVVGALCALCDEPVECLTGRGDMETAQGGSLHGGVGQVHLGGELAHADPDLWAGGTVGQHVRRRVDGGLFGGGDRPVDQEHVSADHRLHTVGPGEPGQVGAIGGQSGVCPGHCPVDAVDVDGGGRPVLGQHHRVPAQVVGDRMRRVAGGNNRGRASGPGQ